MFTVKIENMDTNLEVHSESFDSKKDANKFKKELMKINDLIKHAGRVVNYISRIELTTNY